MVELDKVIRHKLEEPQYWHLATVNPDGSPQVTTVWVDLRDGLILVNSALGRRKTRNIEGNPGVALSWHDPEDPHHSVAIQGRVVETTVGREAEADIDGLAQKYLGRSPYPWRQQGEQRVTYLIEPFRVHRQVPG